MPSPLSYLSNSPLPQVEDPSDCAAFTQEGRLTLVDLAGSERQSALLDAQSKSAMQDSVEINKSLFTLRKVRPPRYIYVYR